MTDIDDRIRAAYRPARLDDDALDTAWDDVRLARPATAPARHRRTRTRAPRVLVAIAVAVVSMSSLALAQSETVQDFISSGDRSKAADRMEVFEGPAVGTRGLSVQTRNMLEFMAGHSSLNGAPSFDAEDLRHVLTYRDDRVHLVLRSAPSPDGEACMYFTLASRRGGAGTMRGHSGGGGCSLAMRYNGHVMSGTMGDYRIGRVVVGLADDAVTRVRVRLSDGSLQTARLQRNGFVLRIGDYRVMPRGLLVDLDDGTTLDVGMNGCLRSQLTPPPKSRLGCGYGMNKGPSTIRP